MHNVSTRYMNSTDVDAAVEIERLSFDRPWTNEEFTEFLSERRVVGRLACNSDGELLGYALFEAYAKKVTLLNIAVSPYHRGLGIGRLLMDEVTTPRRCKICRAFVRDRNLDGQLFLSRLGFVATDVLPGFYERSDDDAYLMVKSPSVKPPRQSVPDPHVNRVAKHFRAP